MEGKHSNDLVTVDNKNVLHECYALFIQLINAVKKICFSHKTQRKLWPMKNDDAINLYTELALQLS